MKRKVTKNADGNLVFPGNKDSVVNPYDIIFIKMNDYAMSLHVKDGRVLTKVTSLKGLLPLLPEVFFAYIHRTYAVNLSCVKDVSPYEIRNLQLDLYYTPEKIIVAERKVDYFNEKFEAYKSSI